MIELFDIRYAENYILDEDVMYKLQGQLSPSNLPRSWSGSMTTCGIVKTGFSVQHPVKTRWTEIC